MFTSFFLNISNFLFTTSVCSCLWTKLYQRVQKEFFASLLYILAVYITEGVSGAGCSLKQSENLDINAVRKYKSYRSESINKYVKWAYFYKISRVSQAIVINFLFCQMFLAPNYTNYSR